MEWSRAKSILILLMLLANIYLGLNIAMQIRERSSQEKAMAHSAWSIITQQGVVVDEQTLLELNVEEKGYVLLRDTSMERTAAEGLLGHCHEESPGGGIYSYSSERGELTFRSGGYIELEWQGEGEPGVYAMLSQNQQEGFEVRQEDDGWRLYVNGDEVIGAFVGKNDGDGVDYSGSWAFGIVEASDSESLSRPAMILALGRALSGTTGADADRIDNAYVLTSAQSGDMRLIPVWRVYAGDDVFFISQLTGERLTL